MALTTFSDLVQEAREKVIEDARKSGWDDDDQGLNAGGSGATAYGDAVAVFLGFIIGKLSESNSTICTWSSAPKNELVVSTFRRQALPMTWDFGEGNPFANSSGSIDKITKALSKIPPMSFSTFGGGIATQADAQKQTISRNKVISTDPLITTTSATPIFPISSMSGSVAA